MTVRKFSDQGFDDYRRERKRQLAKLGPQASVLGYENQALRELEQVEAREVRDQQLTREVHDFFAAATLKAAAIVDKVARDAQAEAGARLEQEVESFLIDALSRMNSFVVSVMQQRRNVNIAETSVEPHIGHLVGPGLDQFRHEGTADIEDKHIGQDPFATDVEDVQREFRLQIGDAAPAAAAAPIEEHLVAETSPDEDDDAGDEHAAGTPRMQLVAPTDPVRTTAARMRPTPQTGKAERPAPAAKAAPAAAKPAAKEPAEPRVDQVAELEGFKNALKALVRQGVMQPDEARAAWQARLDALGLRQR